MLTYVDNVELVIKWYHRRVWKFLIPMVFKWWRSVKRFTSYAIKRIITGQILTEFCQYVEGHGLSVCLWSVCLFVCGHFQNVIAQWVLFISSSNHHCNIIWPQSFCLLILIGRGQRSRSQGSKVTFSIFNDNSKSFGLIFTKFEIYAIWLTGLMPIVGRYDIFEDSRSRSTRRSR